jgi:predicted transposase YdaD
LEVLEVLNPEFQFIGRRGDSLLRVRGQAGEFGALAELQLSYDPKMPARVQNYTAMGRQKLGLDIVPIVVYLTPPPSDVELATAYHTEFMGLITHQDFKVIRLWEIEAAEALALDLPAGILPYVPLMAGADEETVRICVERIRAVPDHVEGRQEGFRGPSGTDHS